VTDGRTNKVEGRKMVNFNKKCKRKDYLFCLMNNNNTQN
jgi:hypothetical protein